MNQKKYSPAKPPTPKEKPTEDDRQEHRQHYNKDYKEERSKKQSVNQVSGSSNPLKKWAKYNREVETEPESSKAYCDYHKLYGHTTLECRHLQQNLIAKFQRGEIQLDGPGHRGTVRTGKPPKTVT